MTRYAIPSVALGAFGIALGLITGLGPCLTLCFALPAAICGHIGEAETRDGRRSGRSLAMAGAVLGWVSPLVALCAAGMLGTTLFNDP